MKTNRFYSHLCASIFLIGRVALATPGLAQTVAGDSTMTASPKEFKAIIFSLPSNPSVIKVNFDNPTSGSVRVVIRHENGNTVYNEFEQRAAYRGRFDVSGLPAGNYTVELRKKNEQYVQTFTIERPSRDRISMGSLHYRESPDRPGRTKLIATH